MPCAVPRTCALHRSALARRPVGGVRLGVALGAYCLGCCWVLMGLLFVGGVMNLVWIAAIAAFILFEKAVAFGVTGGRVAGAALILLGVLIATGVIAL